jgi:hypothetical protein
VHKLVQEELPGVDDEANERGEKQAGRGQRTRRTKIREEAESFEEEGKGFESARSVGRPERAR